VRRRIALALCVLWIVGFEVMPWMHVAMHDRIAPHYHDANGTTIYLAESDPIPAGGHVHTHVYPRPPGHHDKHDDGLARLVGALNHGKDTLAHHGIAVPARSSSRRIRSIRSPPSHAVRRSACRSFHLRQALSKDDS
jgi:hypothetical protein